MLMLSVLGCVSGSGSTDPCGAPVEQWCFHSEQVPGPELPNDGAICDPPPYATELLETCGDWEATVREDGAFAGFVHYFLDGEHVASRFFTDADGECGSTYWYGPEIDC